MCGVAMEPLSREMWGDMGRYGEISQVWPWSPSHGSPALARGRAVRQEQWSRTLGTQAAAPPCLAGTSFSLPCRRPSRRSDYSTTTRRGASRSRTCGASPRSWYPKPPSPTPTVPEPTLPSPTVPEPTLVQGENMTDGELQQVPRATLQLEDTRGASRPFYFGGTWGCGAAAFFSALARGDVYLYPTLS